MVAGTSPGMRAPKLRARLLLLLLLFAAVTAASRGLQQQDGATLPPASEAQSGGGSGGEAPPAAQTDAGLGREGAAEGFAVADQTGSGEDAGDVPPGDLPADDVAALLGSEAAALGGSGSSGGGGGTSGGDILGGGGTEEEPPVQPTDPSKRVGEGTGNRAHCSSRAACYIQLPLLSRRSLEPLFFAPPLPAGRAISLLRPSPGFIPPELTQEQRDMVPKLQKARQGAATVSASRQAAAAGCAGASRGEAGSSSAARLLLM